MKTQREILFRAKRADTGKWIESPGLMIHKDGTVIMVLSQEDEHLATGPVIPESIGEYTGLTDKNGTKIFEGDLVVVENAHPDHTFPLVVTLIGGCFCLQIPGRTDFGGVSCFRNTETDCYRLTGGDPIYSVLGNIYDHPELIKQTI